MALIRPTKSFVVSMFEVGEGKRTIGKKRHEWIVKAENRDQALEMVQNLSITEIDFDPDEEKTQDYLDSCVFSAWVLSEEIFQTF